MGLTHTKGQGNEKSWVHHIPDCGEIYLRTKGKFLN